MTAFAIVPADPEHENWIRDSFSASVRDSEPYAWVHRAQLMEDFIVRRRRPEARTLVAHVTGTPDIFLGWLAAVPGRNEVLYGFTKYAFRQQPEWRIATTLAEKAGIDFSKPVGLRYWSRAAERIGLRDGYRLYHKITEEGE